MLNSSAQEKRAHEVLAKILNNCLPKTSHKRWKSIFSVLGLEEITSQKISYDDEKKLKSQSEIMKTNRLLSFRALIGPTAKADVVYYLHTNPDGFNKKISGGHPSFKKLAEKLHYHPASVMRAYRDLKFVAKPNETKHNTKSFSLNFSDSILNVQPNKDAFFFDWFSLLKWVIQFFDEYDYIFKQHEAVIKIKLIQTLNQLTEIGVEEFINENSNLKLEAVDSLDFNSWQEVGQDIEETLSEFLKEFLRESPYQWGNDSLTKYLESAHWNTMATYANISTSPSHHFKMIGSIDDIFEKISDYKRKLVTEVIDNNERILFKSKNALFQRAFTTFRAAASLSVSGQNAPVIPLCRLILESGLYACHLNPEKF